jgi:deoxyribodipyrimidine photolyase-related protein
MSAVSIVFPHQLFKNHSALDPSVPVYIIEEWLFFQQYPFHFQKLLLHRASMQQYKNYLDRINFQTNYIETTEAISNILQLVPYLAKNNVSIIRVADPVDNWLHKRLTQSCKQNNIQLEIFDNQGFLNTCSATDAFFEKRNKFFQTDFYTWQRKSRKILVNDALQPVGGKWTFDAENREKFPKNKKSPDCQFTEENELIIAAKNYIIKHFPNNPGIKDAPFMHNGKKGYYPISFDSAHEWLIQFLNNRFQEFGIYEDAMVAGESILHHSVLSPLINIGLLTPEEVLNETLHYVAKNNIPLNSFEGFIRQIIGWREFIYQVYARAGSQQRTRNYWGFKRKIPTSFYSGNTGIVPLDDAIQKLQKTGYNHHIERLMIIGNFMLLCEFDPNQVYQWFMEMYVDAYDWVMVPNVYGMTQFADGGLMTTKPYISGSNYILKMSNYPKGDWQEIWDGLFWRFMHLHRSFFLQNPRLGMLIKTFDKMPESKQQLHLSNAEKYLQTLDK